MLITRRLRWQFLAQSGVFVLLLALLVALLVAIMLLPLCLLSPAF